MTFIRFILKVIVVALVATSLSSCSLKLAYNYADWWINWSIDDYVELTEQQAEVFEQTVDDVFAWHRKNELPFYIEKLTSLRAAVVEKNTEQVGDLLEDGRLIWRRTAQHVLPNLIANIQSLSPQQRNELISQIANKQKEQHDEWRDERKELTIEDRIERSIENVEERLGTLTKKQNESLAELVKNLPDTFELRVESREQWLVLFREALTSDKPDLEQKLSTLLLDFSSYRSQEYQELIAKRFALQQQWYRNTLLDLTESQQKHILAQIDDLIEDLADLSAG